MLLIFLVFGPKILFKEINRVKDIFNPLLFLGLTKLPLRAVGGGERGFVGLKGRKGLRYTTTNIHYYVNFLFFFFCGGEMEGIWFLIE